MTLTQAPTIDLSAPVNLRDLGGTPVADGVIATGFALRSDDLATITEDAADALVTEGLRSVIDLRSRDEVFITGRGPLLDRVVNYHHVPLMATIGSATTPHRDLAAVAAAAPLRTMNDMPSMHDLYVSRFETAPGALVSALAIMAHSPGATAFHCAAGKDRTGVLAAALLLALGADDETIIADYRATYPNLEAIMTRTGSYMHHVMALAGFDLQAYQNSTDDPDERLAKDQASMADTLATLRARYGDPLTPLYEAGLSTALIDALRERAVIA
ncbi:hypothetical protein GCM10009720_23330 [Yaniella flava]|uniref:Tyrosine specific protein phosphatases domain-containing protein n=1 Tax=Yaniella flava TaxID=287930 RepID=A0ABN2UQT0_9MICC